MRMTVELGQAALHVLDQRDEIRKRILKSLDQVAKILAYHVVCESAFDEFLRAS